MMTNSDPVIAHRQKAATEMIYYVVLCHVTTNELRATFSRAHPLTLNNPNNYIVINWREVSATPEEITDWTSRL